MFNSNATTDNTTVNHKKLPKGVIMMIEKNNLVMAIKTLATDENITMDAAKARIDAYEAHLKSKQQQKINAIANKQGIPSAALSSDSAPKADDSEALIRNRVKTTPPQQDFVGIQHAVDSKLNSLGYKKPLIPYWAKRLFIIGIIMAGLFFILWNVFG